MTSMKLTEVTDEEPMVLAMVRTLLKKGEDIRISFVDSADESLTISKIMYVEVTRGRKGPKPGMVMVFHMMEPNGMPSKTTLPFDMAESDWDIKKKDGYFLMYHKMHKV